jgi:hypothetical protein
MTPAFARLSIRRATLNDGIFIEFETPLGRTAQACAPALLTASQKAPRKRNSWPFAKTKRYRLPTITYAGTDGTVTLSITPGLCARLHAQARKTPFASDKHLDVALL